MCRGLAHVRQARARKAKGQAEVMAMWEFGTGQLAVQSVGTIRMLQCTYYGALFTHPYFATCAHHRSDLAEGGTAFQAPQGWSDAPINTFVPSSLACRSNL